MHSYFIEFTHPKTQETLIFLAPFPQDLREVMHKLRDRRIGLTDAGREVLQQYCEQGRGVADTIDISKVESFSHL